jgi:hypothetical protein
MNARMNPANAPSLCCGEAALPGKPGEDEDPDSTEDVPPGEHKREPIDDPDPADAPLQVRRA